MKKNVLVVISRSKEFISLFDHLNAWSAPDVITFFEDWSEERSVVNTILVFDGSPGVFPGTLESYFAIVINNFHEFMRPDLIRQNGVDLVLDFEHPHTLDAIKLILECSEW